MSGGSMEYMYSKDPLEQLGLLRRYLDTIETLLEQVAGPWRGRRVTGGKLRSNRSSTKRPVLLYIPPSPRCGRATCERRGSDGLFR